MTSFLEIRHVWITDITDRRIQTSQDRKIELKVNSLTSNEQWFTTWSKTLVAVAEEPIELVKPNDSGHDSFTREVGEIHAENQIFLSFCAKFLSQLKLSK